MFLLGIGGKIGSGKTSVARALSILYSGEVISIASTLKGGVLQRVGMTSFFPQIDETARKTLQHYGLEGRKVDVDLWVKIVPVIAGDLSSPVFVPDVRFENEITYLREYYGRDRTFFVYLSSPLKEFNLPPEIKEHESERISPSLFDFVVTEESFVGKVRSCVKFLKRKGIEPSPRKPILYIGSNIHHSSSYLDVFNTLETLLEERGYDVINPCKTVSEERWSEMLEEMLLDEASRQLVVCDLSDIHKSDGGVFYLSEPSIGAAMEIYTLAVEGKTSIIGTTLEFVYHPWLRTFGKVVWEPDPKSFNVTMSVVERYFPPPEVFLQS